MSERFNLSSMPSAPYAREGRNNVPHRRTVAEMRRSLPAGARDFGMFRTGSGRASNGFCRFTTREGVRVARYHDTDILAVAPNGDVAITFGGWHTISTRERFNVAAQFFGLRLRAVAIGKADVTGFGLVADAAGWYPGKAEWRLDDTGSTYAELRISGPELGLREFEFSDGTETYRVSPFGHISRACLEWRYSGSWTMRGLVQRDNFGNVTARVDFANLAEFIKGGASLTFANGKPRWHVADMDHGCPREWGNGITRLVVRG